MKNVLILILCVAYQQCLCQELIQVGSWRSHFSYNEILLVEEVGDKVFGATSNSILYFNPQDNSLSTLSKLSGLSDAGISAMSFDQQNDRLVVAYENGNIDVIQEDQITNNTILLESEIVENKAINHVSFYNGLLNMSTDFGVVVIDPLSGEVRDSYRNLGENGETIAVEKSVIVGDNVYLATSVGVLMGNLSSGLNLSDFNNWERYMDSPIINQDIVSVETHRGKIYAATSDSLFELNETGWSVLDDFLTSDEEIVKLRSGENVMTILTDQRVYKYALNTGIELMTIFSTDVPNDIIEVGNNEFWYASSNKGLSKLASNQITSFMLNGPLQNIEKVKLIGDRILGFPELNENFGGNESNGLGYSVFEKGTWEDVITDDLLGLDNISDVVIRDQKEYVSSFGSAIYDADTEQIYDASNSTLEVYEAGTDNILVTGMSLAQDENIWVSIFSDYPLHKLSAGGSWERFTFDFIESEEPTGVEVNRNGDIWMPLGHTIGAGILAYDPVQHVHRHITISNSSLPSNRVNDIVFNKDDQIWIATEKGVVFFPFSFGVIEDQGIDVIEPVFENAILFKDKSVTAIAIDGGDRKWMGTKEGVWLLDDSGGKLIHHFNVQNSPLPSNNILDIVVHPKTGEVFIVTDNGLVSYRGKATEGSRTHQNVKVFPNPVLPNYNGLVGINGLAADVSIKITTVSGRLVREIEAAGGGASWDIMDYTGRRVNAGIYLLFSSTALGEETFVGKIAIIN